MYNIAYAGSFKICIYGLVKHHWYTYHIIKPSRGSISLGQWQVPTEIYMLECSMFMNHCYFLVNEHNMYIGNKSVNYPNCVKERYQHILNIYLLYTCFIHQSFYVVCSRTTLPMRSYKVSNWLSHHLRFELRQPCKESTSPSQSERLLSRGRFYIWYIIETHSEINLAQEIQLGVY